MKMPGLIKTIVNFVLEKMKAIIARHPRAGNWIVIDFVIDSIANKRAFKNLTVIDPVSKVAPKIVPAFSMRGEQVVEVLDKTCSETEYPDFFCSVITDLNSETLPFKHGA